MDHKFSLDDQPKFFNLTVGDKVVYTNDFGVCWGIRTITEQAVRTGRPVYMIDPTDTPWYHVPERNLRLATEIDLLLSPTQLQERYGFTPTEWYGCY